MTSEEILHASIKSPMIPENRVGGYKGPWQGGHHGGCIRKVTRRNAFMVVHRMNGQEVCQYVSFRKYGDMATAQKVAEYKKAKTSLGLGAIKNQFRICYDADYENHRSLSDDWNYYREHPDHLGYYAEMKLSNGNQIMQLSLEDLDLAQEYHCHLKKDRYAMSTKNNKAVFFHRLVGDRMVTEEYDAVDHVSGETLNNRRYNLNPGSFTDNNRNHVVPITVKSGKTGVYLETNKFGNSRWRAEFWENNQKKAKSFSVKIHGYDNAFEMACDIREKAEERLGITIRKRPRNDSNHEQEEPATKKMRVEIN